MMRFLCVLVLLVLSSAAWAQSPAPLVRTTLHPADGIVIGQPVRLDVEVLFPGEMPRPPRVALGDVSGAQVMRFESQATTIRETIGGQDHVGQSFEFVVFPRRGGDIEVPAAKVTLLDRAGEPVGSAQGQPMRFTAAVPPGIDPSGPVLAAARVEAGESWSPDPASASFKAGGAITRIIRRRAAGVPALGMAEFRFTAPDGVRVYVDPPEIDDKVNRGEVEGTRTDKVTYVFERPGTYALPGLSQPWWDTARKQARSEPLAGATITVAASDAAGRGPAASGGRWITIALAGLVVLLALFATRPRLATILHRRRDRHRASAAFARKVLMETAPGGDAAATCSALGIWLQRLPATAREAVGMDPRIRALREKLDRALFGPDGSWSARDGALLAQSLAQLPASVFGERRSAEPALPPLNPSEQFGGRGSSVMLGGTTSTDANLR